jgi:hypothetical protein
LSKEFSASTEMLMLFLSLILLTCCVMFNNFHMMNHFASLEWNLLDHSLWSFQCVVVSALQIFCWQIFHQENWSIISFLIMPLSGCLPTDISEFYSVVVW